MRLDNDTVVFGFRLFVCGPPHLRSQLMTLQKSPKPLALKHWQLPSNPVRPLAGDFPQRLELNIPQSRGTRARSWHHPLGLLFSPPPTPACPPRAARSSSPRPAQQPRHINGPPCANPESQPCLHGADEETRSDRAARRRAGAAPAPGCCCGRQRRAGGGRSACMLDESTYMQPTRLHKSSVRTKSSIHNSVVASYREPIVLRPMRPQCCNPVLER